MIWKAIAVALWFGSVLLSLLPRRVASLRSGLFIVASAAMPGFRATALTYLALIGMKSPQTRYECGLAMESRTNDNYYTATALQIKPEELSL